MHSAKEYKRENKRSVRNNCLTDVTGTNKDLFLIMPKVSPLYSALMLIYKLIEAAIPTVTIIATAGFINAALAVVAGTRDLSAVVLPIAGLIGVMLIQVVAGNIVMNLIQCRRAIYLRRVLRPMIVAQVASLEYRHIENKDTADLISRVATKFDTEIAACFDSVVNLATRLLSALGVILTVMTGAWWAGLIIIVSSVPLMFVAKKAGERSYEAQRETSKIHRRTGYLSWVLKSRDAVEERTVYGYTDALNAIYMEQFDKARKIQLRVDFKNFIKMKAGGVLGSVIAVVTILTMIPSVLDGSIDYGLFIALMGGIINLVQSLSWGINGQIQEIAGKKEYLKDLAKFMALESVKDADAIPEAQMSFDKITFENVSFSYPGTDKLILNGLSFTIEKGKHYSFVGVNGAGKTTITKLLTGLYTNYTGEIMVDGRSLREFSQAKIKGLSTVVYQDFARYSFSLYDNITIGAINSEEPAADSCDSAVYPNKSTASAIDDAVELIGLSDTVKKLPNGMQTYLGKVYKDGVDISGGEWQRVAMARSWVRSAPLCILDEPTAALDPLSESRVYSQFEEISRGRTTIFISHRLGSTKLADIIYVLDDGRVAEQGSHSELMRQNGLYARMYTSQAEWYSDREGECVYV